MTLVAARLTHLLLDELNDAQTVFLRELDGPRRLSIAIGAMEAVAIRRALDEERFVRPLTHDLLLAVVSGSGRRFNEVRIVDMREGTYYAEILLEATPGTAADEAPQPLLLDCRPSDALALLVRCPEARLLIDEALLTADDV